MSSLQWILVGLSVPVIVVVLLCLAAWFVGRRLDADHVSQGVLRLRRRPEEVFALIADVRSYPSWNRMTGVERLPDDAGREVWRQRFGRNSVVTVTTVNDPPRRFQQTIADDHKFFSGTWTYEIAPTAEGCTVTLTEHGTVHHAIPRFMMKFVVDPALYLKGQLRAMATKFGEEPRVEARRLR